jgi:hypothetical protein
MFAFDYEDSPFSNELTTSPTMHCARTGETSVPLRALRKKHARDSLYKQKIEEMDWEQDKELHALPGPPVRGTRTRSTGSGSGHVVVNLQTAQRLQKHRHEPTAMVHI